MSSQPISFSKNRLPRTVEKWDRLFAFDAGSAADGTALLNAAIGSLAKRLGGGEAGSRAELAHVMKLFDDSSPSLAKHVRGLIGAALRPGIAEAYALARRPNDVERRQRARVALSHCGLDPDRMPHPRLIPDVQLAVLFETGASTRH